MTTADGPRQIASKVLALSVEVLDAVRIHVLERHIRDRPLAAYQSVAHTISNHWVAVHAVAAALASRVKGADGPERTLAVALGATQAALALCDDAVRLRGGNGYLASDSAAAARDEALRLARSLGDPSELAERLGRPEHEPIQSDEASAAEVSEALEGVWTTAAASHADVEGVLHDPDVHRAVVRRGWLGAFVAHARLNPMLSPSDAFAVAEALALAGIPIYALNTTAMAAALIRDHGSDYLRTVVYPPIMAGEAICALGYTEPHAGSDLAALRTTATRRDGGWVLHGIKRFCTLADQAAHVLVLARSDAESERHRGLTLFAVPAGAPGLDIRLLPTHGGEVTTELRLTDVMVGDEHVIGDVGGGWRVVMGAMRYERNASPWCDAVRLLRRAEELGGMDIDGRPLSKRPSWARNVGLLYVDVVLGRGLVDELLTEESPIAAVAPSAVKLFCTESVVRSADRLTTAIPAPLQLTEPARRIDAIWRRSISLTIAGGASEVQRDMIAMQGLGLPRPA